MSTTTGRDLLERAERLTMRLAHCDLPTQTAKWESFDTTVYRLMRELIGPSRSDSGAMDQSRALLLRVIHSFPTPLRPPLDTVLTAAAAARFVQCGERKFREQIHRGEIEATLTANGYEIASRVLDRRPDIAPADPADPHPMAQLSTTLGVLADMASEDRREPRTISVLDDTSAVESVVRILSCASVAARYTLRYGPAVDGGRPLAVAQHAERSVDVLGAALPMAALDGLVARIETAGTSLNERLDTAIHRWAQASHADLSRTIPATQVMSNIADIGAMMLATRHHLIAILASRIDGAHGQVPTNEIREGAQALKAASVAWKTVTTLQPQSRVFGIASLDLFKLMRDVIAIDPDVADNTPPVLDLAQARRSIDRGIQDLGGFITQARDVTRACLNSGVLFAPVRVVHGRTNPLADRNRRTIVPVGYEAASLLEPIEALVPVIRSIDLYARERSQVPSFSQRSPTPVIR